ncbi:MAG: caspase family protein [Chitinophagaceae bacterium]|nr:caspase family protein [Chitinophagaceae bacterium]
MLQRHVLSSCIYFLFSSLTVCVAQLPRLVVPVGHTGAITEIQFSRDGKKILTISNDGTGKLWETRSGKLLKDFKPYVDASMVPLKSARFTPDGNFIVLNYAENPYNAEYDLLQIWEMNTGKEYSQYYKDEYIAGSTKIDQYNATGKKTGTVTVDETMGKTNPENKKMTYVLAALTDTVTALNRYVQYVSSPNGNIAGQVTRYEIDFEDTSKNYSAAIFFDAHNGKRLYTLSNLVYKGIYENDFLLFFSPDGKKIILPQKDSTVSIRMAANGKIIMRLRGFNDRVNIARFSGDGRKIITASGNQVKIWESATGRLINELKGHTAQVNDAQFSPDGKKIVTASADHTAKIWDAVSGKYLVELTGRTNKIQNSVYSADGKKIYVFTSKSTMVLNTPNGNLHIDNNILPVIRKKVKNPHYAEDTLNERRKYVRDSFSPDGMIQVDWGANVVNYWTVPEEIRYGIIYTVMNIFGMPVDTSKHYLAKPDYEDLNGGFGLEELITDLHFSPDSRKLLITCEDNTVRLYDMIKHEFVFSFFPVDGTDYLLQIPSGYYQSSTGAARLLHYVTNDLKVISFEQLDVKYNRPDLVLQTLGNPDTALIKTYRNAYYKRLKKLGVDTTSFRDGYSLPEAGFVNRDNILTEQKKENMILHIKGTDSTYKLDRYNVWVNEVPVYGQRGSSIRKNNSNNFDKTIAVKLSQGENRIETSITNVNGTESYRMPLVVKYTPAIQQKETTYFIGIGIDKFADATYNLNYSTKDIRDLAVKLKQKYGNNIVIDTLFNEHVSISNVKALKQKLLQTTVNDKVIISYSGHGLLSKDYDYYLSTFNVNFAKPEENGLSYDELESLLDSIPARKKLMLIDACHSGEVDKEEFQQVAINKSTMDSNHVVSRGVVVTSTADGSKKLGLQNSFELMQNLFVNVGKSTGATIISAAAGTEFALEKGDLKNGVFTYCVMEAMDKYPSMKISELKKVVGARVVELTKGMQKPTSRNEAIAVDWEVW